MSPPSCAGTMGQDPPPPCCCQGAQCQRRPGTPGKRRCCRWGAGGAVGGRGGQGAGPLPAVTPPTLSGDGSWHSRTLSRLSGSGGAGMGGAAQRGGGAAPSCSPLPPPPVRGTWHGVQPPQAPRPDPTGAALLAAGPSAAWGWGCWGSPSGGAQKAPLCLPPWAGPGRGARRAACGMQLPAPPQPRAPAPLARPRVNDPPSTASPQQPPRRAMPGGGGSGGGRAGGPWHGQLGGPAAPCPTPHPSVPHPDKSGCRQHPFPSTQRGWESWPGPWPW